MASNAFRILVGLATLTVASIAPAADLTLERLPEPGAPVEKRATASAKANTRGIWIVTLEEPSVIAFREAGQLPSRAKALRFEPTAPDETGSGRWNAETPAVKRYRAYLASRQQRVLDALGDSIGRSVKPRFSWDLAVNGFAIELDASEARRLEQIPGVVSVTPDWSWYPQTDVGPQFVGASAVWNGTIPGSTLQTRGEGVVVGIIDSGINPTHPAFADQSPDGYNHTNPRGQRFGLCGTAADPRCNDKLIGIHDFINEAGANGANAGLDLGGHGTHVAATAVGNPVSGTVSAQITSFPVNASGVAPRANLIVYKACRESGPGDCPGSATIAAVNQAIADGVDLINFSIGGSAFSPWDDPRAFLSLRAAGALAAISTGNRGPMPRTVGSPSNAPWVVSVANATSPKSFTTTLVTQGPSGFPSRTIAGQGVSGGVAEAPLVYAGTFGDPYCVGSYPGGTFTGRIVVCKEGKSDALFQKAQRVGAAGAIGLVVANHRSFHAEFPFATMVTLLPTVHVGTTDGDLLIDQLELAARRGETMRARIDGLSINSAGRGSILNDSSSKGPVTPGSGYLKPNISAPGTNISAAFVPNPTSFDALTGTSMASPHVAGAIALLSAAQPTWTPAQIESALLTSARDEMLIEDGDTRARYFEGGAGMLDIAAAMKSGLHFNTTQAEFLTANPATGGRPEDLNMPYLHTARCVGTCTFTRTVTANVGGSWTLGATIAQGASIEFSPGAITLAAGQTATITTTITVTDPKAYGRWLEGQLRFTSTTAPASVSTTVVPVSVFASGGVPSSLVRVTNAGVSGSGTIALTGAVGLAEVHVTDTRLDRIDVASPGIGVDPTEDEPFDNTSQNFVRLVPAPRLLPSGTDDAALFVEVTAGADQDMDLYVGFDLDEDERPDENETLCVSARETGAVETCYLELPSGDVEAGLNYWIMVQNYASPANAPAPNISVYSSPFSRGGADLGLTVEPLRGKTTNGQELPIRLSWHMPQVGPGGKAVAVVRVGADRATPGNIATLPIVFERSANTDLPPIVLNAKSDSVEVALQPGQAHERIVVDVPPNQTALVLRTDGNGGNVDLYVSKATGSPTPPNFAAAPPRNQQPFSSVTPTNTEVVALEGAQLSAGRYYVTPVNSGTAAARVTLSVIGEFTGATVQPAANGYFNPARSGHGVFLAKTPQVWALAWYTFDNAGKPVWYTAQGAAAAANDGLWSAPIFRSTWNGVRDNPQQVGEVILTFDGTGSFTYSWFLDGQYGSEPFLPIGAPVCANGNFSVGGGWLRPDQSGWGSYFLNFAGNFEAEAIYVYDQDGLPRWVIGDGTYATSLTKNLFQVSGFCPTCPLVATTRTQVGTASRTLANTTTGTFSSNITFADGLTGTWVQNNVNWVKLTPDLACP